MNNFGIVLWLLIFSLILLFLGYSFVFNTITTLNKFISSSQIEKGTMYYNIVTKESNIIWLKIGGVFLIISGLIFLAVAVYVLFSDK